MDIEVQTGVLPAPLLYRWDDIVLSFSATSQLKPHSHGAAELVVSLDRPVRSNLGHHLVTASTILIPPGIQHQNAYEDPISAILYLDVESYRYKELAKRMTAEHSVFTGIPNEKALQQALVGVYDQEPTAENCYLLVVEEFLKGAANSPKELDPRVEKIAKVIAANPSQDNPIKELAEQVNLSEDRLHHLFTAELGLPIHKYRVWLRLKQASMLYFSGRNLTFAAHEAGFSDAAHFSRTFSRMYGAPPSKLLTGERKSRVHFS